MVKTIKAIIIIVLVILGIYLIFSQFEKNRSGRFSDNFDREGQLFEAGSMAESQSNDWWLNSGAILSFSNGVASTVQGQLPLSSVWYERYAKSNPLDTDKGSHPQNIFRLVTKSKWENYVEECYFRISGDRLSDSPNRNESNGLLLFNRYKDGDNLYYAGLRVDGTAVIKKKTHGIYYTMAQKPIIDGKYHPTQNPNLLSKGQWIGIRTEVSTESADQVRIKLSTDLNGNNDWQQILETVDDGKSFGGQSILGSGYAGIRTDFMDVEMKKFSIMEIKPHSVSL